MDRYLRAATEADMDLLFEWANEPLVRKNSFSTEKIPYEEHRKWFARILNDESCRQYIYVSGGEAAGQVRIMVNGEIAEISYSICAKKRGMGHGKLMLQLISELIIHDFPTVKRLIGKVKPDNIASQKAFMNAGFEETYYTYEMSVNRLKCSE